MLTMATSLGSPALNYRSHSIEDSTGWRRDRASIRSLKRGGSIGFKHFERFFVSDCDLLKTLKSIAVTNGNINNEKNIIQELTFEKGQFIGSLGISF